MTDRDRRGSRRLAMTRATMPLARSLHDLSKKNISPEDKSTFRTAVRGVKRLKNTKLLTTPQRPKVRIRRPQPEEDEKSAEFIFSDFDRLPTVTRDEKIEYKRSDISYKILRKLRAGQYNMDAILDLHGMTVDEARVVLYEFLKNCRLEGFKNVLMIHGKGHTKTPILKNKLNNWLRQTPQVLAFCSVADKDGRSGALYVLLKGEK